MRQRRHAHLECNARDAAEHFVHIEYFFRYGLRIPNQQGTRGSAHGVELRARGWRPTAFLADLGEGMRVAGIKIVGSLPGRVPQEADGVKPHYELFGRVARAATGLTVEVDQGTESSGFATDDRDHQRESEHTGTSE